MINTFWLVLGYDCNNKCHHCYATQSRDSNKKWMKVSFAKDVMMTLKKQAKTCLLIGGKPTLFPNIAELISFGSKIGLKMIVVTNGRKFKNEGFAKNVFSAGLSRAVISLEGMNSETHNSITGCKSFNDTVNGIKNCAKVGKVNTLTTICKNNKHQIFSIIKLAHKLGSEKIILNCAIPILNQENISAKYCLNPNELAEVIQEVFRKAKKENIPFQLNATFPLCLLPQDILEEAFKLDWISVGCHMYRGKGVVFDPNGNILPCTHFSEAPLIKNAMDKNENFAFRENFFEIWESPKNIVGKFRSTLWKYPAHKCIDCKYWGGCIGGCPLLWSRFDPLIFVD
jgi:radical SAM protein with 4Fe4S-binding SPASM domain